MTPIFDPDDRVPPRGAREYQEALAEWEKLPVPSKPFSQEYLLWAFSHPKWVGHSRRLIKAFEDELWAPPKRTEHEEAPPESKDPEGAGD